MDIKISIPGSAATIKVARQGDKILLEPVNFDRDDPTQLAALATALSMVKDSSINLPGDDSIHEKVAVVAIPGGAEEAAVPTTAPPPAPEAQAAGGQVDPATEIQELRARVEQMEAMLAQAGIAPPPQPQQAAPAQAAPPAQAAAPAQAAPQAQGGLVG